MKDILIAKENVKEKIKITCANTVKLVVQLNTL
jgi:hypothetical protein